MTLWKLTHSTARYVADEGCTINNCATDCKGLEETVLYMSWVVSLRYQEVYTSRQNILEMNTKIIIS